MKSQSGRAADSSCEPETQEDPWAKLDPAARKKAERHLYMLYAAMIILGLLPFILFLIFRKSS
jgi:hypothetical protein